MTLLAFFAVSVCAVAFSQENPGKSTSPDGSTFLTKSTSVAAPVPASMNVLILALDEADLRSVRPSSVADIPALLDAAAQSEQKTPEKSPERAPKVPGNPLGEFPDFLLPPLPEQKDPEAMATEESEDEAPPLILEEIPGEEIATRRGVYRIALAQLAATTAKSTLEAINRRSPGRAQAAAAPLRRALIQEGVSDVLTVPLDGPTVVRTVNSGRLRLKSLDRLRYAIKQLIEGQEFGQGQGQATGRAARLQEIAAESAAHIGLALNYRAVVVVAMTPGEKYALLLVDAVNETSESLVLAEGGNTAFLRDEKAMGRAAQTIAQQLRGWTPFTPDERKSKVESSLRLAEKAIEEGQSEAAQNHLLQAIALDASDIDAYLALGDLLLGTDRQAAATIYERAAEIDKENGKVWARIATAYSLADPVDWAQSLRAAERALATGHDSAALRIAMATAEFGRAQEHRKEGRIDQAEDTELRARRYLEKARELSPEDAKITAQADRLQAGYLLEQERYGEAAQTLGALAVRYPEDLQTQELYARALEGTGRHEEDLFAAWSRVWTLSGQEQVVLETDRYIRITDGFDQRLFALARSIFSMTSGVATGTLPRESAQRQAARSHEEMKLAVAALQRIAPPAKRTLSDAHALRLFASDLMEQAADLYMNYLTDGSQTDRSRAVQLHREAIERLNRARLSSRE